MLQVALTHPYAVDPERVAAIVYFGPGINVAPVEASLAIKVITLVPVVGVDPVTTLASEDDIGVAGEGVDVNHIVSGLAVYPVAYPVAPALVERIVIVAAETRVASTLLVNR
jgi:hypothetical protein